MHKRERVYYLTLTNDTSLRVEGAEVDVLDKWLDLMCIIPSGRLNVIIGHEGEK